MPQLSNEDVIALVRSLGSLAQWSGPGRFQQHNIFNAYASPTVEPGIYIDEEGIGVRIEDDVLVTKDGYEILSDNVPRAPDEVERFVQRAKRARK